VLPCFVSLTNRFGFSIMPSQYILKRWIMNALRAFDVLSIVFSDENNSKVSHSILDGVEVQITRLQSALGED